MPRPRLHASDRLFDVVRELVLAVGVRATTVDQVVARSGVPKGSIYHRFPTFHDLLAATWLRSVARAQAPFVHAGGQPGDALAAAVAAGLATFDFADSHPEDARLLATVRREDLLGGITDPDLATELIGTNDALASAVTTLARRLYGRASRSAVEQTLAATVDLPLGVLRRHLEAGQPPPKQLRGQLEAAIRAVLAHDQASSGSSTLAGAV